MKSQPKYFDKSSSVSKEGEGKFANSLGTPKIERYYSEVLFEQVHPLLFPPTIKGSEVMHTAYIYEPPQSPNPFKSTIKRPTTSRIRINETI